MKICFMKPSIFYPLMEKIQNDYILLLFMTFKYEKINED